MLTRLLCAGWGLLVCVMAMVAAAAVEWHCLKLYHADKTVVCRLGAAGVCDGHGCSCCSGVALSEAIPC